MPLAVPQPVVHERLDDLAAAMPDVATKVDVGWRLVLEKLSLVLGKEV